MLAKKKKKKKKEDKKWSRKSPGGKKKSLADETSRRDRRLELWRETQPIRENPAPNDGASMAHDVYIIIYFCGVYSHKAQDRPSKTPVGLYCPGHAGVKGNGRADRLAGAKQPPEVACFSKDLKCWEAWDTTCGHKVKDITPSIAWLGERRGKRKRSTIFLERTREGHRQSNEHWNRFKGNVGETSERRGGAHKGFSERIDTILKRTEYCRNVFHTGIHDHLLSRIKYTA